MAFPKAGLKPVRDRIAEHFLGIAADERHIQRLAIDFPDDSFNGVEQRIVLGRGQEVRTFARALAGEFAIAADDEPFPRIVRRGAPEKRC